METAVALGAIGLLAMACAGAGMRTAAAHPSAVPAASAASSPPAASSAGLPSPPVPGAAAPASLTITGALSGQVRLTGSRGPCGKGPRGYGAQLVFQLQGQPYVLSLQVMGYQGPGQYSVPPERVSLHTETGAASPRLLAATHGTVTVDADERSGSV